MVNRYRFFGTSVSFFTLVFFVFSLLVNVEVAAQNSKPGSVLYDNLPADEFLTNWMVLGPLPVFADKADAEDQETQKLAFDKKHLTKYLFDELKEGQPEIIDGEEYRWQHHESGTDIVDFNKALADSDFVFGYAWAEINMPEAKTVLLGIGSDDALKIWLNGQLVHKNWIPRAVQKDDDLISMSFQKGKNQILLKVQDMQFDWGFCCRMIGPDLFPEKLVDAAGGGDLDELKILVGHGADVNSKYGPGLTALHSAKIRGREKVTDFLLENGANPNIEMPAQDQLVRFIFKQTIKGESPGAAVLAARDGLIVFEEAFGYANLENNVPVSTETKFRIGSVTKQFTAAAILKLQEQGLLNVTDTLSKFIPDFPRANEVTIHHLLTHISGIHSYTNNPDFLKTVTLERSAQEMIEIIKDAPYDFNPGERWQYNNSGYYLLGYIIEEVSGLSYGEFLKKHFFEPLRMNNSGVHQWSDILKNEAAGYSYINGTFQKSLNWDMSQAGGAGILYSTIEDLYLWNEAVFGGKVLSEESLEAAFNPVVLNDGSVATAGGKYGYGWGVGDFRGVKIISHGGGLHGFQCFLVRFPEKKFSAVVLTNSLPSKNLNPTGMAFNISEVFLWEEMENQKSFATDTSVDTKLFEAYAGKYEYPRGMILTVTREDDRMFAQMSGQPKFEIFPSSGNEFFWKVSEARIVFERDENGLVSGAVHYQGGQELIVPRIEDPVTAVVDPVVYDAYTGEYELAKNMIITVTKEEKSLFIQLTGQPKLEIFPSSESEFFLKVVKARIRFNKADDGKISSLILTQGGMDQTAKRIK